MPSSDNTGAFVVTAEPASLKCNTEKDRIRLNHSTAGILAGIWPCGTISLLGKLFEAESKSQVYAMLHTFLCENRSTTSNIKTICYDDGCHLKKYASNSTRMELTETSRQIASLKIVVDKMHFKGHTDTWCHQNCNSYNPYHLKELDEVDTQICKQTFSWMSRYVRITQHE